MVSDPAWLGILAVVCASALMVLRPVWFFGRKLSLEEALSVCWVAWSIYMGAFVVYIGLKLPIGSFARCSCSGCLRSCLHIADCHPWIGAGSHRLEERGD